MPGIANLKIFIKKNKIKKKTFGLSFCLNKECPKLLCGLDIGHRRIQTIPIFQCGIVRGGGGGGGGGLSSGHHCMSGVCGIEHYVMTW